MRSSLWSFVCVLPREGLRYDLVQSTQSACCRTENEAITEAHAMSMSVLTEGSAFSLTFAVSLPSIPAIAADQLTVRPAEVCIQCSMKMPTSTPFRPSSHARTTSEVTRWRPLPFCVRVLRRVSSASILHREHDLTPASSQSLLPRHDGSVLSGFA